MGPEEDVSRGVRGHAPMENFLKTGTLENAFPGILAMKLRNELSCNYTVKTMLLEERQSDFLWNCINKKWDNIFCIFLVFCFS